MMLATLIESARPRQWIKNLLVYAGFLFTFGCVPTGWAFLKATEGFIAFCLLSSAAYLLNDLCDSSNDARHPTKKHRPITSGRLSEKAAAVAAVICLVWGLAITVWLGPLFAALAALYVIVTIAYNVALKHTVLIDVMTVSAGYVIRAFAGAAAIDVPASFWLAFCTLLLALFLSLCKRRAEMTVLQETAGDHRAILNHYTVPLLDQMISVVTASALMAYALYTYHTPTTDVVTARWSFREHLLTATIPFVVYGIYRYLFLVYTRHLGGAPEVLFLKDRPLLLNVILWGIVSAATVYIGRSIGVG